MPFYPLVESFPGELSQTLRHAMHEDVRGADHSSMATIPADQISTAQLRVKDTGILAGMQVIEAIVSDFMSPQTELKIFRMDGDAIVPGDVAFEVTAPTVQILACERLMLNLMQRLSGVATKTHSIVQILEPYHTTLLDTRKTTPNIRFLEKWAVTLGGAQNHRFGLFDMIMLKDNHIDAAGSITIAVERTLEYLAEKGLSLPIEVETRSIEDLEELLPMADKVNRVMFDNFSPASAARAVELVAGRMETECSGGITSENIVEYAATGVDFISSSQITHSVRSLDLSLKIVL